MFRLRITEDLGFEVWQDIPDYEGLYQASTYGRIKSLERLCVNGKGRERKVPEAILKQAISKNGYLIVRLSNNGVVKNYRAHRLIALTFIANPLKYPCVNHKSEIRHENSVGNLEWCSYEYNVNYGTCKEKISKSHLNHPSVCKAVNQYNMEGNIIATYISSHEIQRICGYDNGNIRACCKGKLKTAYGYIWRFAEG